VSFVFGLLLVIDKFDGVELVEVVDTPAASNVGLYSIYSPQCLHYRRYYYETFDCICMQCDHYDFEK
jgi:hypothetical protein